MPGRPLVRRLVLAALVLPLAACSSSATDDDALSPLGAAGRVAVPSEAPDIRGTITRVQHGDSVVRQGGGGAPERPVACPPECGGGPGMRAVLVEETPGAANAGDKSRVAVPAEARVLRRADGRVVEIGFDALRTGQQVEAWFSGPVAESYPTQSTALVIVVVGG